MTNQYDEKAKAIRAGLPYPYLQQGHADLESAIAQALREASESPRRCYACAQDKVDKRAQCFDCWKAIEMSKNTAAPDDARVRGAMADAEKDDACNSSKTLAKALIHARAELFEANKQVLHFESLYLMERAKAESAEAELQAEREKGAAWLETAKKHLFEGCAHGATACPMDKMQCYCGRCDLQSLVDDAVIETRAAQEEASEQATDGQGEAGLA